MWEYKEYFYGDVIPNPLLNQLWWILILGLQTSLILQIALKTPSVNRMFLNPRNIIFMLISI